MHPSRPSDNNRPLGAIPPAAARRGERPDPPAATEPEPAAPGPPTRAPDTARPAKSAIATEALSREDRRARFGMEIASLSQQDLSPSEYFTALLPRLVAALPAAGAAVWVKDEQGTPRRAQEHRYPNPELTENPRVAARHRLLLAALLEQTEAALVLPGEGGRRAEGPANLSSLRLLLLPLFGAGKSEALVEICQQAEQALADGPDEDPAFEDLEFARQMCELAGDYLRAHALRQLRSPLPAKPTAASGASPLPSGSAPKDVAAALAARARSIAQAERALVLLSTHEGMRLAAFDAGENSAANPRRVPLATELAAAALKQTRSYDQIQPGASLPIELGKLVARYCRDTGAHSLTIRPLTFAPPEDSPAVAADAPGLLILEHSASNQLAPAQREELDRLVRRGSRALTTVAAQRPDAAKARESEAPAPRPGWKQWFRRAKTGRPVAIAAVLLLVGVALAPVPWEFSASAVLRPARSQFVRSEVNGAVRRLRAQPADDVAAGEPLLEMDSWELQQQMAELAGRLAAAEQRSAGLEQGLLDDSGESTGARNRLASDAAAAAAEVASLRRQWELLASQRDRLTLVSPTAGRVLNADLERELLNRPVKRGDVLMEIADPNGPWQLDIALPPEQLRQVARQGAGGQAVIIRYQSPLADEGWLFARVTEIRPADTSTLGGTVHATAMAPSCSLSRGRLPAEVRVRGGYRPLIYVLMSRAWQ